MPASVVYEKKFDYPTNTAVKLHIIVLYFVYIFYKFYYFCTYFCTHSGPGKRKPSTYK